VVRTQRSETGVSQSRSVRVEQLLLDRGFLTEPALEQARTIAMRSGRALVQVLVEDAIVPEEPVMEALATISGAPFVRIDEASLDLRAATMLPDAFARRAFAVGIAYEDEGRTIVVATSDPTNPFIRDDVSRATGLDVRVVAATRADVLSVLARATSVDIDASEISALAVEEIEPSEDATGDGALVEDAPIVRLLNVIVTQAVDQRASDVHLEPQEHELRVRYRIDGVLHEQMRVPRALQAGLVSRLKVMADLDIAERRVPQDGRVGLVIGGRAVDLRVATLPTVHGEKAVIRILDKGRGIGELATLGFSERTHDLWNSAATKPHGMLLVTGPTGSGKSTTLYATLQQLNQTHSNIITVEDPVEYRLNGVNQVQVNVRAGLTFASALRSILRADPDIVLIGEIRDAETARIAIQAALTGHLVLSTLHTNDAPSAITRLIDMGVEPFLVSSALDAVLAQRLVRVLCERCKQPAALDPERAHSLGLEPGTPIFEPAGCPACSGTGYKGRRAITEIMPMNLDLRRLAADRAATDSIEQSARAAGMKTLRDDCLRLVVEGATSLNELARVVV
jgi:type IV pilus assembly protein PilB